MTDSNSVSLQFKNSVTGSTKLQRYEQQLKDIKTALDAIPKNVYFSSDATKQIETTNKLLINLNKNMSSFKRSTTSALGNMKKDVTEGANSLKKLSGGVKDTRDNFKNLKDTIKFGSIVKGTYELVKKMSSFTSVSADYVENLNLMNVAFHRTKDSMEETALAGERLVNTLSDMYGLDESSLTRTVGLFKQLSNAMGVSDEVGNKLTQTLTQMSIDVSSLYNVSFERATSVLQSSLAGQTKPIRGLAGADITEPTLQVTLDTYGIDRTVRDLSYVEKRLIIVTSLIEQLEESQNDYGKTIESVSNQMRVFNEQTQRLTRAIGNVFLPILQKILPFINGVIMVITELINLFAELIGFDESMLAGFAESNESVLDMEDGLKGADDNAKKLKQTLRSFDKLNVITTPTDTGAGAGGAGGIDQSVLDAFNKASDKYAERLETIKMKATEIRDSIMEWLGFTKVVDEETGKVSFKFDHITDGTVLGALIVGGTIFSGVKKVLGFFTSIGNLLTPGKGAVAKNTLSWGKLLNGTLIIGSLCVIAEAWGDIYSDVKNMRKESEKMIEATLNHKKELIFTQDITQVLHDLEINRNNAAATLRDHLDKNLTISKNQVKSSELSLERIMQILDAEDTTLKTKTDALSNIKDQYYWNEKVIEKLEDQGKDTTELVKINDKYKEALGKVAEKIDTTEDGWKRVLKQAGFNKTEIESIGIEIGKLNKKEVLTTNFDNLKTVTGDIFTGLKNITGKTWSSTLKLKANTSTFVDNLVNFFEKLKGDKNLSLISSSVTGAISSLKTMFQRKKDGMAFVPNDYYGPVYLDYGERVLTKEENEAYSRGITNNISNVSNVSNPNTVVSPTIVVKVGDEELARKVLTNLQDMATANGQVIEIGG